MNKAFLNKKHCLDEATRLVAVNHVLQMDVIECAKEIYAHAKIYYTLSKLPKCIQNMSIVQDIQKHADPIDLEDGGDTPARKRIYDLIWVI